MVLQEGPTTFRDTRPANTRVNQMAKRKGKNISNRKQRNLASSKRSSLTTASPEHQNKMEKQHSDLKLHLMMMIQDFKKVINNSLKEMQQNTGKQVETLRRKINSP
jgi:glycerol-3-phosphate cytidylyltransferase-like family protein